MADNKRGRIAFFATYRPPVPLDIFSCPNEPTTESDEVHMTDDGESSNYNGQHIPAPALKTILKCPILIQKLAKDMDADVTFDVDSGCVSGMVFVSERAGNLETLHIAIRFNDDPNSTSHVMVFSLAELYGDDQLFKGVRMEDSGCFAGDYLVYVSTKEDPTEFDPSKRRQPWTAVYRTDLKDGKTQRLTPPGEADLSPAVSPSGKKIAMASFQHKEGGWSGETEHLMTDIVVMDLDDPLLGRTLVIKDGGWPTWGSDDVLFFHRRVQKTTPDEGYRWRVYRADISSGPTSDAYPVTTDDIGNAMTPAAISATRVAVATIRQQTKQDNIDKLNVRESGLYYRHIEIFDTNAKIAPVKVTETIKPLADHYNPFVIRDNNPLAENYRIGYHRCSTKQLESGQAARQFDDIQCPHDDTGLFRVSGAFPTFSSDGEKLAFVDNEFRNIWLADGNGLRVVYTARSIDSFFSPVWNQDPGKDTLYVCIGHAFRAREEVNIGAIPNVSVGNSKMQILTKHFNNAFPSTSKCGKRLVYRSTRDWTNKETRKESSLPKNLYIMEDAEVGEYGRGEITRLTEGEWIDTHCQWSPTGDWIVFSSTRDKPSDAPDLDNGGLDPGYYAIYLVNANRPDVVVRVMGSGNDLAGHINHPCFSPDGKSIVVSADLAAVSVDPISLPLFMHTVRPYGDIFSFDIDTDNIENNWNIDKFHRITHSRYENSTPNWTKFSTKTSAQDLARCFKECKEKAQELSSGDGDGDGDEAENWHMTGHLCIGMRRC